MTLSRASTTTLRHPMRTMRLGYLDINFPTSATMTMATLRTASSTTALSHPSLWLCQQWRKGLSFVLSTLAGFFSSPGVRAAHVWTAGGCWRYGS
uniref:Uncharacterized protein n=1 Tax=Oryza brachyantha TaxID=4533 RepID=J3LCQ4_ORYBR